MNLTAIIREVRKPPNAMDAGLSFTMRPRYTKNRAL